MCTGPLVKFTLVNSHLVESWRANFSRSLTSGNLVCVFASLGVKLGDKNLSRKTCPCVRGFGHPEEDSATSGLRLKRAREYTCQRFKACPEALLSSAAVDIIVACLDNDEIPCRSNATAAGPLTAHIKELWLTTTKMLRIPELRRTAKKKHNGGRL